MNFRSKNLLVTGGAGFIGSNFIKYLLEKYDGISIYNLDKLTYASNLSHLKNLTSNKSYKFIHGDICDNDLVSKIFKNYNIDGVINFAAETHVDNSIINPDNFIKTNINGVYNLLNISYKFWMNKPFNVKEDYLNARFHQISTDEVYGSILKGSFTEKSSYAPNSPYSASKASADMLIRSFHKTYGLNVVTTISSNNFGPNQNNEKFIPKIIQSLINKKTISVYGDGLNIRDWIYVMDNCHAIEKVFNNSASGEKYNVGGENEISNIDLIDIIFKNLSKKHKVKKSIRFVKDRYGHDRRYSLNINKIKNELNWVPKKGFLNTYSFSKLVK